MSDLSLTRVKLGVGSLVYCQECAEEIAVSLDFSVADAMRWADEHRCPGEELTDALTVLRLLIDETPCTDGDLSPAGLCPHGWIPDACPDRRAWEILKRHPEIEPSLPVTLTHEDLLRRSLDRALTPETPPESLPRFLRNTSLTDALNLPADGADSGAVAHPIEYLVSVLPAEHKLFDRYAIRVRPSTIADNQWQAVRFGAYLDTNGRWSVPKTDDDWQAEDVEAWNTRNTHTKETALRLAREAAPAVVCRGKSAGEILKESS